MPDSAPSNTDRRHPVAENAVIPGGPLGPVVAILYAGELGSAFGRILLRAGRVVITTAADRSPRTAASARAAGFTIATTLSDAVADADVIISAVPPGVAIELAREVVRTLPADGRERTYVDLNAISPMSMDLVASAFEGTSVHVVDGAIHGRAEVLEAGATLYLSGPRASRTAALIGPLPRTIVLGERIGQASLFKMLLGGVNKGVVALMLELSWLAEREGVLEGFWTVARAAYPGVMEVFERLLPSYPLHVERRVGEMAELASTVRASGGDAAMAEAIRQTFENASRSPENLQGLVSAGRIDEPDVAAPAAPVS